MCIYATKKVIHQTVVIETDACGCEVAASSLTNKTQYPWQEDVRTKVRLEGVEALL